MDNNPNFLQDEYAIIEENKYEESPPENDFEEEFSLDDHPEDDFFDILSFLAEYSLNQEYFDILFEVLSILFDIDPPHSYREFVRNWNQNPQLSALRQFTGLQAFKTFWTAFIQDFPFLEKKWHQLLNNQD